MMIEKTRNNFVDEISTVVDYAFQPIVNVHSGTLIAVEALLRNYQDAGFDSIESVFHAAYQQEALYTLDLALRRKALDKYCAIPLAREFKLFYNIDNRVLVMPDYETGNTLQLLEEYHVPHNHFCFEISEKSVLHEQAHIKRILANYKNQNFYIAIDDYGAGFSGLQQLYNTEPNFIKIDRFFIHGIDSDYRKKKFVSNMVNLAHIIGVQVIAEGVETREEFLACREIGCEYVQGYFIQHPQTDTSMLQMQYDTIEIIIQSEQRQLDDDRGLIVPEMQRYAPIAVSENTMEDVFNYFRHHGYQTFVPVINSFGEPMGIIHETMLKKYVYSPYGRELLCGKKMERIHELISTAPVCEISTNVEAIIELYNQNQESVGILLTEKGVYQGFLTARALLTLIHQKNVTVARNQNPLTKLPGNISIMEKISALTEQPDSVLCYFDFDNFKPFNDTYGFRTGDRAIQMFADILNSYAAASGCFVGHIGGDDFVLIQYDVRNVDQRALQIHTEIIERFRCNVENLYDNGDRSRGYIESVDRFGTSRCYPLLTVSCVIVDVNAHPNPDTIPFEIAEKKKIVKESAQQFIVF